MISYLFNEIFYKPLFNGLIFLYSIVPGHDMGISIVILTIFIRLLLWPLNNKGLKNQKILTKIQPEIEDIKKKFKNNKEEQAKALMKLYSENNINPLAGFLPIIIQIPILFALWRVFLNSIKPDSNSLYWFIKPSIQVQPVFLGVFDLTARSVLLAIIAGVLQYFQTKMIMSASLKTETGGSSQNSDFNKLMSHQMLYFGPILSIIIFWNLPAALPLYWVVVTVMTLLQQYLIQKHDKRREFISQGGRKN